jgi:hypothetical protein
MKPVKNFVFAALLVFSIALNTFAGDIDQPGAPAPPPPRMTAISPDTNPDNQETVSESSDYVFLEALAVLLSVY